jgi:hypothetical protein
MLYYTKPNCPGGTMLECAVRVGPEWLAAALYVQTNGWTEVGGDD